MYNQLIIQIPCFNEEEYICKTIDDLPKKVDGIDKIETLIINDGSTDNTLEVAKNKKVDHIVTYSKQKGLFVLSKLQYDQLFYF